MTMSQSDTAQPGQVDRPAVPDVERAAPNDAARGARSGRTARYWAVAVVLSGAATGFVLWKVWVCDDAFITFRHVSNFLAGYGPVFNPGERVQAFTHPLWFGLLSAGAVLFDVYAVAVGLGLLLTAAAFGFLAWLWRDERYGLAQLQLAFVVLLSSKTFVEFQTSGLENSLSNLLVVVLWGLMGQAWLTGKRFPLVVVAFLCGLLVLNRPDHTVIAGPAALAAVLAAIKRREWSVWGGLLLAALPVIGWYGFATVYYGTPLPNTVYAKVVMPWSQAFPLGMRYLADYLRHEPLHAAVITVAVAGGLYASIRSLRGREPGAWIPGLLAISVVLHLVYVASVGGDYMRGRFVDIALVAATVLGMQLLGRPLESCAVQAGEQRFVTASVGLVGAVLFLLQMQSPHVLRGFQRGLEWLQYSLSGHWAVIVLIAYLVVVVWLIGRVRRMGSGWADRVFAVSILITTALLVGLSGYSPPKLAVTACLLVTGLCIAYAWAMTVAGRGLSVAGSTTTCILVAAAASLCDIDRRSESGGGALSDEFSCYHVRGWHNPFRHPVEALRGTTARWRKIGLTARRYADAFGPITVAYDSLGVISYYSGPNVRVIDLCGLAEPYLNRSATPPVRRCGHVPFEIPRGYFETRGVINLLPDWYERLENLDPSLGADAAKMAASAQWERAEDRTRWKATERIIAGELFSRERWGAIPRYMRPERKYVADEAECLRAVSALAPPMQ